MGETKIDRLVFQTEESQKSFSPRFTQDSPIYPEVWKAFGNNPSKRYDLILTPFYGVSAISLMNDLKKKIGSTKENFLASSGDVVGVKLSFEELIKIALPFTKWYQQYLWVNKKNTPNLIWLEQMVLEINNKIKLEEADDDIKTSLWSISLNREAKACVYESVGITKADATRRLFSVDGGEITWAVLDSGVDASHNGFVPTELYRASEIEKRKKSRIIETYDFTKFRELISEIVSSNSKEVFQDTKETVLELAGFTDTNNFSGTIKQTKDLLKTLENILKNGQAFDWSFVSPLLRVPYDENYKTPVHPHGTHVAGILGANFKEDNLPSNRQIVGMCPGIKIMDIRVLDEEGKGDEFNILAALQFIRWLNGKSDRKVVHGINISLSLLHNVENYATGGTPICDSCNRLVNEGTVVVAAAGNLGQSYFQDRAGLGMEGFRTSGITDPGNAEGVITVGATHRSEPHNYGVSYFSSKGPTGDGRLKPDLLAPGEKIVSLIPGNLTDRMDGSSMAAPHVSGAAALLMSKHKELIGDAKKIKSILCETATDLGRDKYFQGYGLIDTLRALQKI